MKRDDIFKPKVMRERNGDFLVVIYNNREETYTRKSSSTFAEETKERGPGSDPYTRFDAEELCRNSGMNEIHFADIPEIDALVCKCEKEDIPERELKHWKSYSTCHCHLSKDNTKVVEFDVFDVTVENER